MKFCSRKIGVLLQEQYDPLHTLQKIAALAEPATSGFFATSLF
jgi:hypothetical protein